MESDEPELKYFKQRRNPFKDRTNEYLDNLFGIIVEKFGISWLEREIPIHPIQLLWRRRDVLATNELYCLGEALSSLKNNWRWLKDNVKKIKGNSGNNSQGALFEIVGLGMLAPSNTIIPAKESQPGFDAILELPENKSIRISMKNYGLSSHQKTFTKYAEEIEIKLKELLKYYNLPPVQVWIDVPNSYPDSKKQWDILFNSLPEILLQFKTKGEYNLVLVDNFWFVGIGFLQGGNEDYHHELKSYTLMVSSVYHKNEHKNIEDKIDEACANLIKHSRTESSNLANFIHIHLPETASVNNCRMWIEKYFEDYPNRPISGIILYQACVVVDNTKKTTDIGHYFAFILRDGFSTQFKPENYFIRLDLTVGVLLTEPSIPQLLANGKEVLNVDNRYFFQKGNHYLQGKTKEDGSIEGRITNPASGVHYHAVLKVLEHDGKIPIISGIFPPEHKLLIL